MFANKNNAEIPKNPAVMTATTPPPTGRTATNGPSQVLGSVKVVWFAARVILATDRQDAEYPAIK